MSPFLETFKRFPQQIQNLGIIQKIQDKISRPGGEINCQLSSNYGQLNKPTCLDFDEKLGLLAIGCADGRIFIYGTPGVMFEIPSLETAITALKFLPEEGRLLVLSGENEFLVFELQTASGSWDKKFVLKPSGLKANESITCFCLGIGMIYFGSDLGTLRQAAIKHGLIACDDEKNALTCELLSKNASLDKQEELGLDSSIVSVEQHASGSHLLVAYRGGTVIIAKILPIPEPGSNEQPAEVTNGPTEESAEPATPAGNSATMATPKTTTTKEDSALLKKSRTLTMTLKNNLASFDSRSKHGYFEQPSIEMPPVPMVTNFYMTGRQCFCAAWTYAKVGDSESLKVVAACSEGYYVNWAVVPGDVEPVIESVNGKALNPFGPIPCHAIRKISIKPTSGDAVTTFMGGLPSQESTDLCTVAVSNSKDNVTYRFDAEVVDFILIPSTLASTPDSAKIPSEDEEERKKDIENWKEMAENHVTKPSAPSDAGYLIVLTQNELVVIDLTAKGWPQLMSPYLSCLDVSTVSSIAHMGQVARATLDRLYASNYLQKQCTGKWPICGGAQVLAKETPSSTVDLLALGHESGAVSLWSLSPGDSFLLVGMLHCSSITNFVQHDTMESTSDEAWPPYRSVGALQQFGRLQDANAKCAHCCCPVLDHCKCNAIRSLYFYEQGEDLCLVSGGQLGQVIVWSTAQNKVVFEPDTQRVMIELIQEEEMAGKFTWNGPSVPKVREGTQLNCKWSDLAMRPQRLFQLTPPSPICHLTMESEWGFLGIGSQHGMAVYDLIQDRLVHKMFTVSASMTNGSCCGEAAPDTTSNTPPTAVASLKKNLRQSFKKLRKLASHSTDSRPLEPTVETSEEKPKSEEEEQQVEEPAAAPAAPAASEEKPVEEAVVKEEEEMMNLHPAMHQWAVRSISFVSTCLISTEKVTPCMFVGTGSGCVYMYSVLSYFEEPTGQVKLCKELQLQHAAPIIGLFMVDVKERCPVDRLTLTQVKAMAKEEAEQTLAAEIVEEAKKEAQDEIKKEEHQEEDQEKEEPAKKVSKEKKEKTPEPEKIQHDLLVCTEEQVKLFSMPALKPKHKYKFLDRGTFGGFHSTGVDNKKKAEETTTEKVEDEANATPVACKAAPATCGVSRRKRLIAVSLQGMPLPQEGEEVGSSKGPVEWYVIAGLSTGNVSILSLPTLRRQVKCCCCTQGSFCCPIESIAISSQGNSVVAHCPAMHNLSVVEMNASTHHLAAQRRSVIHLEPWMRSADLITLCTDLTKEVVAAVTEKVKPRRQSSFSRVLSLRRKASSRPLLTKRPSEEAGKIMDTVTGGGTVAGETAETEITPTEEGKKPASTEPPQKSNLAAALIKEENLDKSILNGASNPDKIADMTMDTVKDYLNGDGNVTVHTIECSTVKKTVIKDGDIVTTVHEQEKQDGKVVKDDVVKVSTVSPQKTA